MLWGVCPTPHLAHRVTPFHLQEAPEPTGRAASGMGRAGSEHGSIPLSNF